MATLPATDARKNFPDLRMGITERQELGHLHGTSGDPVLMSEEFDSLPETLELLSTPGFRDGFNTARKEAETGDTLSFEAVFGESQ